MTIKDAVKNGVSKIRKASWSFKTDHIELTILNDGKHGPWMHLYSPESAEACNDPTLAKQSFIWNDDNEDDWEEYK